MRHSPFATAMAFFSLTGCTATITPNSFFPKQNRPTPPGELVAPTGYVMTQDFIDAGDLGKIHIVRLDNPNSENTLIYHGGNASFVSSQSTIAKALADATEADLILYDYPGRGGTTVAPTVDGMTNMAAPILAGLKAKGWIGMGPVFNYGLSSGGAQAASMARHGGFAGLIIEASAPYYTKIGRNVMPGYVKPFVRFQISPDLQRYDYLGYAKASGGPVLLIASKEDKIVRPKNMLTFQRDLQAAGLEVSLITVPGGHGSALRYPETRAALKSFITSR